MKSKTNRLSWLCGAIALSLAPLQAQDAKPAPQPAPAPAAVPQADALPKVEAPLTTEELERLTQGNKGPRPDKAGPGLRDGRREEQRGPMDGRRDGHRDGNHHQKGEPQPQGHPQSGHDQAGWPEGFRQPRGPGPRGYERGGFQPNPPGRGPQHFAQRGTFGAPWGRENFRPHQSGPREGQIQRGAEGRGQGRFGSGPGRLFGRQETPQYSHPRLGGGFANPHDLQPRFEHRGGPGAQHFERPMHQPPPGMHGGDHGPGPSPHDGGPRFAPPMQRGQQAPHGPPMNHQRGRGPLPNRTV